MNKSLEALEKELEFLYKICDYSKEWTDRVKALKFEISKKRS